MPSTSIHSPVRYVDLMGLALHLRGACANMLLLRDIRDALHRSMFHLPPTADCALSSPHQSMISYFLPAATASGFRIYPRLTAV
jgi:hypothetical protein